MKSKTVLFLGAAILLLAAGLYMRTQNLKQAKLQADKLVAADQAADSKEALQSLKTYIGAHMGAAASFSLQGSYNRATAAAKAAAAATAANSQIYADAQRTCAGKNDSITQARCNQEYLAKHLIKVAPVEPLTEPKLADYQYNLRAPLWTPDPAGAFILGGIAAMIITTMLFIRGRKY